MSKKPFEIYISVGGQVTDTSSEIDIYQTSSVYFKEDKFIKLCNHNILIYLKNSNKALSNYIF